MAKEVLANAAQEFEQAAAACETQADYYRQVAGLLRRGDMVEALETNDSVNKILMVCSGHIEKSADFLRMLEVADKEYYEFEKAEDIKRQTSAMSLEEAKGMLLTHSLQCRNGEKCELHKGLIARINRG
jgi:hypothetical protein